MFMNGHINVPEGSGSVINLLPGSVIQHFRSPGSGSIIQDYGSPGFGFERIQGGSDKSGIFFLFLSNGTTQLKKIIRFY